MFKIRKAKKQVADTRTTLDQHHSSVVALKFQTEELERELEGLEAEGLGGGERAAEVRQAIAARKAQWRSYYLDVGDLLMNYYTSPAQKQISFFKRFEKPDVADDEGLSLGLQQPKTQGKTRAEILEEYLCRVDKSRVPKAATPGGAAVTGGGGGGSGQPACHACGRLCSDWQNEGIQVCTHCGTQHDILTVADMPSYKDSHREKHNFNYRRINHFTEIMNQMLARQTTDIPEDIMHKVLLELKKQRVTNLAALTREDIRSILRKIGHDDYYDHAFLILSRLTGKRTPPLPPHVVESLSNLFNEAQSLWFVHKPEHRSNFIGYNYVFYKLFELLELDDFKQYCPLLKTRDKLVEYDVVWRKICNDLEWEFVPTV